MKRNRLIMGIVGTIIMFLILSIFISKAIIERKINNAPEPDNCPLCSLRKVHAPVLVCLSTGEVGELEVYHSSPYDGEISTKWDGGTFRFVRVGNYHSYCDSWSQTNHCTVPYNRSIIKPEYFCLSCREVLCQAGTRGYAVVDCYDTENRMAYSITKESSIKIRGYTVSVEDNSKDKSYEIVVTGNYMNGMIPKK